ncbi:hypothetical protein TNCV_697861 [Trichonephila clavipes]|nr:hypothetical protein TNCV_697861 [Trichonephila clavipes]
MRQARHLPQRCTGSILLQDNLLKCDEQCKRHGMKDIQEHVLQTTNARVCEASMANARRVNLTSVLRSGITGHAPMTGFTGVQFVIQLLTP